MATKLGDVTHYYNEISVAVLKLKNSLKIGDKIEFRGHTTDFSQLVSEMQLNHKPITLAKKGQEVALKVDDYVREGDEVFII